MADAAALLPSRAHVAMAAPEWLAPFAERLRVGAPAAARLATRALFAHLRERPALDATPALRRCDATYCATRRSKRQRPRRPDLPQQTR